MNFVLRILLIVWVIAYLVGSCSPILNGHWVLGTIALLGGIFFFIPWVLGIVVLWFLIKLTNPPPRR